MYAGREHCACSGVFVLLLLLWCEQQFICVALPAGCKETNALIVTCQQGRTTAEHVQLPIQAALHGGTYREDHSAWLALLGLDPLGGHQDRLIQILRTNGGATMAAVLSKVNSNAALPGMQITAHTVLHASAQSTCMLWHVLNASAVSFHVQPALKWTAHAQHKPAWSSPRQHLMQPPCTERTAIAHCSGNHKTSCGTPLPSKAANTSCSMHQLAGMRQSAGSQPAAYP
ncbi:hypothetical protein COO60DRAFT_340511 [Scenedesmus sp. NREL 46B-D3]|nr:hypothetical protein COO60DRAFT_340511 [Scenedesmus sp. NREL 46B-D3]